MKQLRKEPDKKSNCNCIIGFPIIIQSKNWIKWHSSSAEMEEIELFVFQSYLYFNKGHTNTLGASGLGHSLNPSTGSNVCSLFLVLVTSAGRMVMAQIQGHFVRPWRLKSWRNSIFHKSSLGYQRRTCIMFVLAVFSLLWVLGEELEGWKVLVMGNPSLRSGAYCGAHCSLAGLRQFSLIPMCWPSVFSCSMNHMKDPPFPDPREIENTLFKAPVWQEQGKMTSK